MVHLCAGPLTVGETVAGEIDFARRFDFMQQHSGEHIVSGILCARHHCDNVGFHIGRDLVTIDFNAALTTEDVAEIEALANQYIWEDHPVEAGWPTAKPWPPCRTAARRPWRARCGSSPGPARTAAPAAAPTSAGAARWGW